MAALWPGIAAAQQPVRTLSLSECRSMAVENNAKVRMAKGKAQSAAELKKEAFTKYFPSVSAQGIGFLANKPVLYHDFDGLFSLGIIKKGVSAGVYAIQPVFVGGQIINGNRLAEVGVQAGELEQQGAADDVQLTVEGYYWQLVTLKSKKSTLASVIAMVDTLQKQVGTAVNAGIVLPNELLKVKIKRGELDALMVDLDNGILLASKQLAQYVGLDGTPVDIADSGTPSALPAYPQAIFVDPENALPGTVDYQLLDKQVEAADLQARMEAGKNLPTVGIGAGYFYDDLLNDQYNFGAAFVSVSIPISGWWGGSHAVKRKKIELENAKIQREDLSQMLRLNMDNTWDNLTASYRKMEIAHESISQAKENLRLNENYYAAGVTSITELLDAQTLYRESEDQYTEAYGNFRLCQAKYLDATAQY